MYCRFNIEYRRQSVNTIIPVCNHLCLPSTDITEAIYDEGKKPEQKSALIIKFFLGREEVVPPEETYYAKDHYGRNADVDRNDDLVKAS